jgi:hypothetical protein
MDRPRPLARVLPSEAIHVEIPASQWHRLFDQIVAALVTG